MVPWRFIAGHGSCAGCGLRGRLVRSHAGAYELFCDGDSDQGGYGPAYEHTADSTGRDRDFNPCCRSDSGSDWDAHTKQHRGAKPNDGCDDFTSTDGYTGSANRNRDAVAGRAGDD